MFSSDDDYVDVYIYSQIKKSTSISRYSVQLLNIIPISMLTIYLCYNTEFKVIHNNYYHICLDTIDKTLSLIRLDLDFFINQNLVSEKIRENR